MKELKWHEEGYTLAGIHSEETVGVIVQIEYFRHSTGRNV